MQIELTLPHDCLIIASVTLFGKRMIFPNGCCHRFLLNSSDVPIAFPFVFELPHYRETSFHRHFTDRVKFFIVSKLTFCFGKKALFLQKGRS